MGEAHSIYPRVSNCLCATLSAALLIFILAAAVAGEGHFAKGGDGFSGFYRQRDLPGGQSPVLSYRGSTTLAAAVSAVGGIMLERDEIIFPLRGDSGSGPRFHLSLLDGERVQLRLDGLVYTMTSTSWELQPLVELAEQDQVALVSLIGGPKSDEERSWNSSIEREHPGSAVFFIEVHPALMDTMLGMQLLLTDIALVNGGQFEEIGRIQSLLAGEFPDQTFKTVRSAIHPDTLRFWLPDWETADDHRISIDQRYDSYVISDFKINYNVEIEEQVATVRGAPAHEFWKLTEVNELVERDGEQELLVYSEYLFVPDINALSRRRGWVFLAKAPELWDTTRRAGSLLALFRQLRRDDSESWMAFRDAVRALPPAPEVETPRAWILSQ